MLKDLNKGLLVAPLSMQAAILDGSVKANRIVLGVGGWNGIILLDIVGKVRWSLP